MHLQRLLLCTSLAAAAALGVETKTWIRSEAHEFEKATLKGIALASDGRLSLAPVLVEKFDGGAIQLWSAIAAGGRVYAGSSDGRLYALDSDGKAKLLTTLEGGGTIYALAAVADGVYAATSPGAKVWRVAGDGKATLIAALTPRYAWAIVPAAGGGLYVATGDPGQVLKIDAQGKAAVLFDAGETHVRSLALGRDGSLIAGTDSSGLVLRVSPKGEGFVLHQTGKREVTALAVAADGTIYAAATGTRASVPGAGIEPVPQPPAQSPAHPGGTPAQQPQPAVQAAPRPAAMPPTLGANPVPTGGSEIWRIAPDGEPALWWSSAQAMVYGLEFDQQGRLIAATGNEGRIYRIDTARAHQSTRLAHTSAGQVTALASLPGGGIAAVTANPGKLLQLGPADETTGTVESDVFDALLFTRWGRLHWEAEANGGSIKFETRSGNLDAPEKGWSAWSPVDPASGTRIAAPAARFLQWRATLTSATGGASPELHLVEAAYQQKNVAPTIEKIEITPFNHKFPTGSTSSSALGGTLTLPPIGQVKRTGPATPTAEPSGGATMNYDKGWIGARWKSADQNGDTLEFKLEYRGAGEREWKLLKEHLKESRYSWDATPFADGRYSLRVTASDAPDNYETVALTTTLEGPEFLIDNTPPRIEGLRAQLVSGKLAISFHAADELSALDSAEFSVNGGEWKAVRPTTGMTDSLAHDYSVEVAAPAGAEWTGAVKVTDENDNVAVRSVVVRR